MKMNKVVSGILLYGFIGLGAVISLFPFYWLAVMATNSSAAFMRFPPVMVFGGQFMTNMTNLLNSIQFGRAMFNTFVVAVCKTVGGVFFCSLASFYFAKFQFPGRRFLFALCLVTMMIPPQLNLIPQLIIMNKLGWLSTFKALILPGLIPAFGIFWMNQYCTGSIHDDLINSARIDGCGTFGLFLHVGLPIMIVTNDSSRNTLQVALAQLQGAYNSTDYGMVMCGVLLATLPLFIIFLLFSRQFTADITAGAIKS